MLTGAKEEAHNFIRDDCVQLKKFSKCNNVRPILLSYTEFFNDAAKLVDFFADMSSSFLASKFSLTPLRGSSISLNKHKKPIHSLVS